MTATGDAEEVVIIGAGQAGLATSYELSRLGVKHVVLERGRVVGYIERYADKTTADIREGVEVSSLDADEDGGFRLATSQGDLHAAKVVLATGAYQKPHRPPAADTLPTGLHVIDGEGYTNPGALPAGAVPAARRRGFLDGSGTRTGLPGSSDRPHGHASERAAISCRTPYRERPGEWQRRRPRPQLSNAAGTVSAATGALHRRRRRQSAFRERPGGLGGFRRCALQRRPPSDRGIP